MKDHFGTTVRVGDTVYHVLDHGKRVDSDVRTVVYEVDEQRGRVFSSLPKNTPGRPGFGGPSHDLVVADPHSAFYRRRLEEEV